MTSVAVGALSVIACSTPAPVFTVVVVSVVMFAYTYKGAALFASLRILATAPEGFGNVVAIFTFYSALSKPLPARRAGLGAIEGRLIIVSHA